MDDPDTLFADGFEDALIGIGRQFNRELALYDYEKCIEILMERDGMSREDAIEFFEFNTAGELNRAWNARIGAQSGA
jgi:hypothetical protein